MDWVSIVSAPVIASLISALVTLTGIIVSHRLSKKNVENEVSRIKAQHSIDRMQDLPARVASFMDEVKGGRIDVDGMSRLLSDIYAYGSPDAIKILVSFQEANYAASGNMAQASINQSYRIMGHLSLLVSQLKYDPSGFYIDPEQYFKFKISDYGNNGISAKEALIEIVEELGLNKNLVPDQ